MRESISYTFLLNIIILFIFVCFAIVMGVFSYYRAFKANTIITSAIEKYEGYNCLSAQEAAIKLNGISYNVPFDVKCKGNYGTPCMVDDNKSYAVVSYNLDTASNLGQSSYVGYYSKKDNKKKYSFMNSQIFNKCNEHQCSTKHYQYGVYTYMYVDLPVVSGLIRIPFFSKTRILYEFRNLRYGGTKNGVQQYDSNYITDDYIKEKGIDINSQLVNISDFASYIQAQYNMQLAEFDEPVGQHGIILNQELYNAKVDYQLSFVSGKADAMMASVIQQGYDLNCGFTPDYSIY